MGNPLDQWSIDREIVLVRVVAASIARVFAAWSDAEHLPRWFGPSGFTCETSEIAVRAGGVWRFAYAAPDGSRYANRIAFLRVEPPRLMEFDHGPDEDDDPSRFRSLVTFDAQDDGKTVVTLRQLHPTREQRDATIGFGAVEYGYQTLDKLEQYLETMSS